VTEADAPAAAGRFPCPKCGAGLLYDPRARGLRCPFCGEARAVDGSGPVPEKDLEDALRAAAAAAAAAGGAPAARGARRVRCDACAAEVEVPPGEKSGRCPYCGSARVHEESGREGRIPPESVVPFAVDRAAAEERFRAWVRSLWFRPNALRSRHALDEMRGVLVPFWTFDARAASDWTAQAGHFYVVPVPQGKGVRMETRIRWEPAAGSRADLHDDLLVCASGGLDAALVRKIEPFDLAALVPFRAEYLAGWAAESYAVDVRDAWGIAERRILAEQEARCAGDVPGDTHADLRVATRLSGRRYRHALLPVWVAAYRFRGKPWRFLVNGQTGEVQGEAPLSWVKMGLLVLGVLAAAAVIAALAGG
jgi:DNA-directed RNA polymerase subunit RPC12/RpoP